MNNIELVNNRYISILAQRKKRYEMNKDTEKSAMKQYYDKHRDSIKSKFKENYEKNKDARKSKFKRHYEKNKDTVKSRFKLYYENNKDALNQKMKEYNERHKFSIKSKMNAYYQKNKERLCSLRRKNYRKNSDEIKAASCAYYRSNTEARKAAYSRKAKAVIKRARQYYAKNRAYICANQRRKYELAEPKPLTKMFYVHKIKKNLMCNTRLLSKLINTFEKEHTSASNKISKGNRKTAISNLAAQRVVCKAIQVRKQYVGALLKAVRYINALKIKEMADFGEGLHSAHSKPYFYDSAYLFVKRSDILTIDQSGICRQEENVSESTVSSNIPHT